MNYLVIEMSSLQVLVSEVDKWLKRGWKPQGGIGYNSQDRLYMQAMVLED